MKSMEDLMDCSSMNIKWRMIRHASIPGNTVFITNRKIDPRTVPDFMFHYQIHDNGHVMFAHLIKSLDDIDQFKNNVPDRRYTKTLLANCKLVNEDYFSLGRMLYSYISLSEICDFRVSDLMDMDALSDKTAQLPFPYRCFHDVLDDEVSWYLIPSFTQPYLYFTHSMINPDSIPKGWYYYRVVSGKYGKLYANLIHINNDDPNRYPVLDAGGTDFGTILTNSPVQISSTVYSELGCVCSLDCWFVINNGTKIGLTKPENPHPAFHKVPFPKEAYHE